MNLNRSSIVLLLLICENLFAQDFKKFGELGHIAKGVLQVSDPKHMVIDNSNNRLYVADAANHRVVVLSSLTGQLIFTFGSYGTGNGNFNNPTAIALASDGSVYVVDKFNHRVQKFDNAGVYQLQFGSQGNTIGKFSFPSAIAIKQSTGDVFVTDTNNHRIQKFSSTGGNAIAWGTPGSADGQFFLPDGIAFDGTNLYVSDRNNHRIQKFSETGAFVTKWGTPGDFSYPGGIAVDGSGQVYVVDTYHQTIKIFSNTGTPITSWGSYGLTDGLLDVPAGIAIDGGGNIIISDEGYDRIQKFSSTGSFQAAWGKGDGNGLFVVPKDMVFDADGNLYVAENENNRIQKFNSNGVYVTKWGSPGSGAGQFSNPQGITVDASNNIYVVDYNRVQKFDNAGNYLMEFGSGGTGNGQFNGAQDIAIDANGNIYVTDNGNKRVQKFSSSGTYLLQWGTSGSGNGQFNSPVAIDVTNDGYVLVTDVGNNNIQKFTSEGVFTTMLVTSGTQTGKVNVPGNIHVDTDNNFWVTETGTSRIQKFASNGAFMAVLGSVGTTSGQYYLPQTVTTNGNKIVFGDRTNRVQFFYQLATEPSAQPPSMSFADVTSSSLKVTPAAATGNPTGYIVLRKQGSSPTGLPTDGEAYPVGTVIGDGVVVHNGNAISFLQKGLMANSTYHYKAFSYNGPDSLANYRLAFPLTASTTTLNSPFTLVKDINEAYVDLSSSPANLVDFNGTLLFSADNGMHGTELWKSDGTSNGTVMVKDINAGELSGGATKFGVLNTTYFFASNDGQHGLELWATNGTEAGTVLVKDINPGAGSSVSAGANVVMNGFMYFLANDGTHGFELWKTDGTDAGTMLVKDIEAGSTSAFPTPTFSGQVFNNFLYFFANTTNEGIELWKTDGTENGTILVKDINPGVASSSSLGSFITSNSTSMFFVADDGTNGFELWKSNGSTDGTLLVKNIQEPGNGASSMMKVMNDVLYFYSPSSPNTGLWKSDGTDAGTVVVKSGIAILSSAAFTEINNTLYFIGSLGSAGFELWKTDGTAAGTLLVKDIIAGSAPGPTGPFLVLNDILYFSSIDVNRELYRSDGTSAGTYMIADLYPGTTGSFPQNMAVSNGFLYFSAAVPSGRELYKTNGTTIELVKNINDQYGTASGIASISSALINDELFFTGFVNNAVQLFKTNGTHDGTLQITANGTAFTSFLGFLKPVGNTLYFAAADASSGIELWKTDGTNAGTVRVKDIYPGSAGSMNTINSALCERLGNYLYFTANDGSGVELWRTDGTEAGTIRVKDINPGTGSSSPAMLANVNGLLFFLANDGSGVQLWKSDGVETNTIPVTNQSGGLGTISVTTVPRHAVVNGSYYFTVAEGSASALWRSDGSIETTIKLLTITSIFQVVPLNDRILIQKSGGSQLWTSDGTVAGTVKLADFVNFFFLGASQDTPQCIVNNVFYFLASTAITGNEIYRSDGTVNGTYVLKDLIPGFTGNAGIPFPLPTKDRFYFTGSRQLGESHVWSSDGTDCKTFQLTDDIANIQFPVVLGTKLVFFNTNSATGAELYSIDLSQVIEPQPTSITTHPLSGGFCPDASISLSVSATGTNLTYKWMKNDIEIPGATSSTFSILSAKGTDVASYSVEVKGLCGVLTSNSAAMSINLPTVISAQPESKTPCVGQAVSLSVVAQGTGLTYQWLKNTSPVSGATASSYTIQSFKTTDAGSYTVVVSGSCGSVTSAVANVTAASSPFITLQPSQRTLKKIGETIMLSVEASGDGLTYQWQKENADIKDATQSTFTKANSAADDSGNYRVIITNTCANVTSDVARVDVFNATKTYDNVSFTSFGTDQSDYRIISIPLELSQPANTVQAIFEDDLGKPNNTQWRIFHYEGGQHKEYFSSSPISNGKGYWLIAKEQKTIDAGPGEISTSDPYLIQLEAGWNQIGNPFATDISWADIVAANPGLTEKLNVFEGSWSEGATLKKFSGGFINVAAAKTLRIPRGSFVGGRSHSTKAGSTLDNDTWEILLNISHGRAAYNLGGIGMSPAAHDVEYDGLDGYNLPRFMDYVELNHPNSLNGFTVSKSIVPTRRENVWTFNLTSNQSAEIASIKWDNKNFGASEHMVVLVDIENGQVVSMRDNDEYVFSMRQQHRFKVIFGSRDYVQFHSLPEQETLGVYPNPFKNQISVEYALPKTSPVTIDILDNQSRLVSSVLSEVQAAGYHSIDLTNETGSWASGIYLVRMIANETVVYKKIIKQ